MKTTLPPLTLSIIPSVPRFIPAIPSMNTSKPMKGMECADVIKENKYKKMAVSITDSNDLTNIAQSLESNTGLSTLVLWGALTKRDTEVDAQEPNKGMPLMAEVLSKNIMLATLALTKCGITAEGMLLFSEALKTNNTLTTLGLSHNPLGAGGCTHLANMLLENKNLKHLRLVNVDCESSGGAGDYIPGGLSFIASNLRHNHTLETLIFDNNNIDKNDVLTVSRMLEINRSLKHLSLAFCSIIPSSGTRLVSFLGTDTWVLESLNLEGNKLHCQPIRKIAKFLETKNNSLSYLNLSSTELNCQDIEHSFNCLAKNNTLKTILLGGNAIGEEGVKALGTYLENNHSLEYLDIQNVGNISDADGRVVPFTDEELKRIAPALQTNLKLPRVIVTDGNSKEIKGLTTCVDGIIANQDVLAGDIYEISILNSFESDSGAITSGGKFINLLFNINLSCLSPIIPKNWIDKLQSWSEKIHPFQWFAVCKKIDTIQSSSFYDFGNDILKLIAGDLKLVPIENGDVMIIGITAEGQVDSGADLV